MLLTTRSGSGGSVATTDVALTPRLLPSLACSYTWPELSASTITRQVPGSYSGTVMVLSTVVLVPAASDWSTKTLPTKRSRLTPSDDR